MGFITLLKACVLEGTGCPRSGVCLLELCMRSLSIDTSTHYLSKKNKSSNLLFWKVHACVQYTVIPSISSSSLQGLPKISNSQLYVLLYSIHWAQFLLPICSWVWGHHLTGMGNLSMGKSASSLSSQKDWHLQGMCSHWEPLWGWWRIPFKKSLLEGHFSRVGEMAQQIRILAALPEVLRSIPTNRMMAHSHLIMKSDASFWHAGALADIH